MSNAIFPPPAPNEVTASSIRKKVTKPCSDLLQDLLAREDTRAEAEAEKELQRIKDTAKVLNPKDYDHLLLSKFNHFQERKISWAFWKMAEELDDHEALGIDSASKKAEVLTTAASILRDELPVQLTGVTLKGRDQEANEFTLRVGHGLYFPVHLWVCRRGPVYLGWYGHLLQGGRDGQIRAAHKDLKLGIESMSQIIRNGGLYHASNWADPHFVINRSQKTQ